MLVTLFIYVVLVVRESTIYLVTAFLPIGFAMMVWPSSAKWFKRMVELLFGVIFSKLVMVAAISIAVASLTAGAGGVAEGSETLAVDGGTVSTAGLTTGTDDTAMDRSLMS